jgi:preprotein translocase subunit SecG
MLLAAWHHTILAFFFAVLAVLLMIVILLQRGKGVGLAGAFGGAGGGTAFGAKTGDVLTWVTVVGAVCLLSYTVVLNFVFVPTGPDLQPTPAIQPDPAAAPGAMPTTPAPTTPAPTTPPPAPTPAPATPAEEGGTETGWHLEREMPALAVSEVIFAFDRI